MLQREDRRRHEHQHLLAVLRRLERRPQRDLGLAVADVAADQPVHRTRRFHVGLRQFDRIALIGRLGEGERLLELALPVGVLGEGVTRAPAALGVEREQLSRELLRRAARTRLHRLPARTAELRKRRALAAGTDVARDLRQLVDRHEHAVIALVFQIQVVARHIRHRARLKAREARHAMVLVHNHIARAQLRERAQRAAARAAAPARASAIGPTALGAAPAQQAVLGEHRQLQRRRDEALAQRRRSEAQRWLLRRQPRIDALPQPARFHAGEVVGRALTLAAAGERDDRAIARAHELLELRLGLGQRARHRVRCLRAQLDRLIGRDRREPDPGPRGQRRLHALGAHIEVVGILVAERRTDVAPVVLQRRRQLLLRGHQQLRVIADQLEQRAEALDREQLGDVRARDAAVAVLRASHARRPRGEFLTRDLGQRTVLFGQLRRRRDLDLRHLTERALRESREPAQRLDLDVEHVHAHGALLGRRVDVEQAPAHRELPALLYLVDALVARAHELGRALVEVEQLADAQRERVRAQRRVGHLL